MIQVKRIVPVGLLVAVAVVVASLFWGPAFGQGQAGKALAAKWEYKVIQSTKGSVEESLNKLGDDGWEVCGTIASVSSSPVGGVGGPISTQERVILKRPKQ